MTLRIRPWGEVLAVVVLLTGSATSAPVLIDSSLSVSHFIDNENGASDDDDYTMILRGSEFVRTPMGSRQVPAWTQLYFWERKANASPKPAWNEFT